MRVLRLDLGSEPIEFHPYLTVVRGIAPEVRQRLLDELAGLPAGTTSVTGILEAHGVLFDLAPATLGLLDLDRPLEVIVRRDDLPHRATNDTPEVAAIRRQTTDAEAALTAAEAAVADAARRHDAADEALRLAASGPDPDGAGRTGSRAAVDEAARASDEAEQGAVAATTEHHRAVEELNAAERAAEAARAVRDDANRATAVAVAALEAASERRDPTAVAVVEAARRRLSAVEEALAEARTGAPTTADPEAAATVDELRSERVALDAALLALDTIDPLPVKLALEQLRDPSVVDLVPSPEAIELAERWAILTVDLEKAGADARDAEAHGEERRRARQRLDAAEAAVAELERGPALDPDDVAELERAYEEVVAARGASEKRFGGGRAAKRLEAALAAERQILDRLGFSTWADFRLRSAAGSLASDEDKLAERQVAARRELQEAEAAYQAFAAVDAVELARAEVFDRRRKLRAAAVRLLGEDPGDDVEGALRRHRVPAASTGGHLHRLRQALEGAGLVLDDEDVDERLLSDLARVWLQEQEDTETHRRELQARLAEVDVRLSEIEARESSPVAGEPLAAAAGAVQDARSALAAAEARLARDAATVAEVESMRAAYEAASAAEEEAAAAVADADARVVDLAAVARDRAAELRHREQQAADAVVAQRAAEQAVADLDGKLAAARAEGLAALEAEHAAATADLDAARTRLNAAARSVGAGHAALAAALQRARDLPQPDAQGGNGDGDGDADTDADDTEWYLLARLAAQRAVSYAGSVPLVLDDALAEFDTATARHLLERLERMASTVQLIIVTEDLATAAWAEALGPERAHVAEGGHRSAVAAGSAS